MASNVFTLGILIPLGWFAGSLSPVFGEEDPKAPSLDPFVGNYRTPNGEELCIRRMGERLLLAGGDGQAAPLEPQPDLTYTGGGARVNFHEKDGEIKGISCRWEDGMVFKGKRMPPPFRLEECTFRNGDLKLGGTLMLPEGPGPHPALILVHGSGPNTRDLFLPGDPWEAFPRAGIAVLSYDKRGCGASTGSWQSATGSDLADDAVAALSALQNRPDIDPKRIGLWGISQGGGIVPIAAGKCPDVAFAILVSAGVMTTREQDDQRVLHELLGAGMERARAEEGWAGFLEYKKKSYEAAARGDRKRMLELLRESKQAWWGKHAFFDFVTDEDAVTAYILAERMEREGTEVHPRHALERMTCPVLAVYGEKDACVPPGINAPRMKECLRNSKDATVKVFPDADHLICQTRTGTISEMMAPGPHTPAPGYLEGLVEWVTARMKPATAPCPGLRRSAQRTAASGSRRKQSSSPNRGEPRCARRNRLRHRRQRDGI